MRVRAGAARRRDCLPAATDGISVALLGVRGYVEPSRARMRRKARKRPSARSPAAAYSSSSRASSQLRSDRTTLCGG